MINLPLPDTGQQEQLADAEVVEPREGSSVPDDGAPIILPDANAEEPADDEKGPLFPMQQCAALNGEWQAIQSTFVDSPRASVERADALVKKTIDTLATSFTEMRNSLEQSWENDREVSTEDLRVALQNYRSFFQRLLSI